MQTNFLSHLKMVLAEIDRNVMLNFIDMTVIKSCLLFSWIVFNKINSLSKSEFRKLEKCS